MDAVCEVDECTAPRRGGLLLGRSERDHAFQHGKRDASPQSAQRVSAVDQPGLGLNIAHWVILLVAITRLA